MSLDLGKLTNLSHFIFQEYRFETLKQLWFSCGAL